MHVLRNKVFISISLVIILFLLISSFLIILTSYFNTKEINNLTSGCYEVDGVITLDIHNNMTSRYSFSCEKEK